MCTVLLPPGDNPIAVNKYINGTRQNIKISTRIGSEYLHQPAMNTVKQNTAEFWSLQLQETMKAHRESIDIALPFI